MNTIKKNSNIQSYNKRLAYLFGTALLVSAAYSSFSKPANAYEAVDVCQDWLTGELYRCGDIFY